MRTQLSACALALSLSLAAAAPMCAQTSSAPATGPATSPALGGTAGSLGTPSTTTPNTAPGWNESDAANLRGPIGGSGTTGIGTGLSGGNNNASSLTTSPSTSTGVTPTMPPSLTSGTATNPQSATTTQPAGLPAPLTSGNAAVPGGALSPETMGAPNTAILDLNAQAPPAPLMGTITQEVALTISKQPVQRGGYTGLVIHVHNGTNSPLLFDGDRAYMKKGTQCVNTVAETVLEETTCPGNNFGEQAKLAVEDAVTVGLVSTIHDQRVNRGPVLNRYGCDQKRRVAANERFGKRLLWPGDDTQGIMFFNTTDALAGSELQLPVVTFPTMEIRGYLSSTY